MSRLHRLFICVLGVCATIPLYAATITLTGTTSAQLKTTQPDGTIWVAKTWTSLAIAPPACGSHNFAVVLNDGVGRLNQSWGGGIIKGCVPTSFSWSDTSNGAAIRHFGDGLNTFHHVRIHNIRDGFQLKEIPAYSNTAKFAIRDIYMTATRDDSVENDNFMSGSVKNSLFDGVHTFFSEQNTDVGTRDPIGATEGPITIDGVRVRVYPTNAFPDEQNRVLGHWFKLQPRGAESHTINVTNSVFAVGTIPPGFADWDHFMPSAKVKFLGTNNFILWLGNNAADYKGAKPAGTTFMFGATARTKWVSVRNSWLSSHGKPTQTLAADYNPHGAPISQLPF